MTRDHRTRTLGGMEDLQPAPDPASLLRITDSLAIPLAELGFEFARSGGPGGQNVNKVNSKATLRWKPAESPSLPGPVRERLLAALSSRLTRDGELLITSQLTRDQSRNVEDCLAKLREFVLAAARPPRTRRPSRPTLGSKVRRVESKLRRSTTKRLRRKPDVE
ncbi:alternative ribosome rescue aminoacyl-tRNA hydrolase ArfB [Tundrisphaera lichenicola]|uniref:alternative ribosome rescue aminoacyl-tRNA hydrolase ArfB n=1 Tax=Tundrisphaera lichenicola TaxID=2029860 RepID=UPI003EBB269A